ncbi:hypothetical protein AgCh_014707 [Apium graveolens]
MLSGRAVALRARAVALRARAEMLSGRAGSGKKLNYFRLLLLFGFQLLSLVAGLEVNLLSVSQFADKGFKVLFNKEECTFISKKTGEVALKGTRKGSLFVAELDSANEDGICCFYTKASVEQSKSWHKKLSHLNFKAINTLVKNELVRDMPNLKFAQVEVCDACQKGKIKRSSHKSKSVNSISAPL